MGLSGFPFFNFDIIQLVKVTSRPAMKTAIIQIGISGIIIKPLVELGEDSKKLFAKKKIMKPTSIDLLKSDGIFLFLGMSIYSFYISNALALRQGNRILYSCNLKPYCFTLVLEFSSDHIGKSSNSAINIPSFSSSVFERYSNK